MKTLQIALAPGAVAGLISIFTSWLWMGIVFHRFQHLTPNNRRPENNRSYAISSAIHFLACIAIATLFLLVARMGGVFADGLPGAFYRRSGLDGGGGAFRHRGGGIRKFASLGRGRSGARFADDLYARVRDRSVVPWKWVAPKRQASLGTWS